MRTADRPCLFSGRSSSAAAPVFAMYTIKINPLQQHNFCSCHYNCTCTAGRLALEIFIITHYLHFVRLTVAVKLKGATEKEKNRENNNRVHCCCCCCVAVVGNIISTTLRNPFRCSVFDLVFDCDPVVQSRQKAAHSKAQRQEVNFHIWNTSQLRKSAKLQRFKVSHQDPIKNPC